MDNWNSDNINKFKKIIEIANRGSRINGGEMTEVYNSVFNKSLKPTNCSSCISQRYRETKKSYALFQEELKKQEEKAKALEVIDKFMTEDVEETITPKKGRRKK